MGKNKFITEFEINASQKILFPYLSTASGLAQWFADDVNTMKIRFTVFYGMVKIIERPKRLNVLM